MGACSSTTEKDADFLMENNFHYSVSLAEFAIKNRVRFINASSAATYGDGSAGFSDSVEIMKNLKPLNMYGYSKHLYHEKPQAIEHVRILKTSVRHVGAKIEFPEPAGKP
jgi:ADP-L-glycero-D-manno-heptose 6-epimerase